MVGVKRREVKYRPQPQDRTMRAAGTMNGNDFISAASFIPTKLVGLKVSYV